MGASSEPLRFANNRVVGKPLGVTLRETFRRVLLMVMDDSETAQSARVSIPRFVRRAVDTYVLSDP